MIYVPFVRKWKKHMNIFFNVKNFGKLYMTVSCAKLQLERLSKSIAKPLLFNEENHS